MIDRLRRVRPASLVSLGALLAVLVVGIAYLGLSVLQVDPLAKHTDLRMVIPNSGSVGTGTPVLLTGIRVGKVTDVRRTSAGVEVKFRIDGTQRIPASSAVKIENLSALGEPYIEFKPTDGKGPYLQNGQLLDTRTVAVPMLIPDLSVRAVQFIDQLDPAAISNLVGTVDKALSGTESQIPRLERATTLLAATLLSRTGTLRQLLTDLQTTGKDMEWAGPALAQTGPEWTVFGQRLEALINTASTLFEVGDSPHDYVTGDGVVPFLNNLAALLTKLGPSMSELVPVLQPLTADMTPALGRLDISALISQAVNTVGDDNAVHLRINVK